MAMPRAIMVIRVGRSVMGLVYCRPSPPSELLRRGLAIKDRGVF
jgi:hypothetical protein